MEAGDIVSDGHWHGVPGTRGSRVLVLLAYPGSCECWLPPTSFQALLPTLALHPCVSKQCPADGVSRIGRGGSPYRVLKTRFTPSESSAGHGLPPQRAPKQCPANGVRRVLWGPGLLDTVKKHMVHCRSFTGGGQTCNNQRATSICPVLFIIFSSLLLSLSQNPLFPRGKSWGKNSEKVWNLWNDFALYHCTQKDYRINSKTISVR